MHFLRSVICYTYYPLGRRTTMSAGGKTVSYTHDAAGQVTGMTRDGVTAILPDIMNATYNGANRMTALDGDSLTYDDNGNLTGWGSVSLTRNARDQLMAVNATVDASFAYDGLGRRIEKTVDETTTTYLYDGLDMVEMDDGTTSYYFVHGPGIDEPLAMVGSDGLVRYYHADMLGSVVALTNSSGVVMTQYNYSPFGETEVIGESSPNPFQFTGRKWDGDTGMYFYRARYYSPVMKRFISEDPIGYNAGDVNFYRYVGNQPLDWSDPLGWKPGDLFDTPEEAAIDAIHYIWNTKKDWRRHEYGGWIIREGVRFTYDEPSRGGTRVGIGNPPENWGCAWYHTHIEPYKWYHFVSGEDFSQPDDYRISEVHNALGYLGTPSKKIKGYIPTPERETYKLPSGFKRRVFTVE